MKQSGVIVKRTPTIVVGGVAAFQSHALRVLDANGDEASTVSVPSDNPRCWALWRGISGKVCGRFYADYDGESNQCRH